MPARDTPFARAIPTGSVNPLGPGLSSSDVVELEGAEGGTALGLSLTGESWAGVYFTLDGYDASEASAVSVRLQLPDGVAELELKLEGPEAKAASVNLMDFEVGKGTAGWRTFSVPLEEFAGVDRKEIVVLGLWNPRGAGGGLTSGRLILDDVHFP